MENKSSGTYQFYKELPTWAKGVLAVAVIGAVGIASYAIYKKVKKAYALSDSQDTADSSDDEYKKLLKKGQKLSFPVGNYISTANTIKESLDGCETFIAEMDVVNAVSNVVKRPIDWHFLVKTFGARMIEGCAFGADTAYALPELLRGQLGSIVPSGLTPSTTLSVLNKYLKKQIGITI